jgi:hypothetical protein
MTMEWDAGPNSTIAAIFEQAPLDAYVNGPHRFRLEWGPIYYRGRLDGSARVLVIGQDPAADENVARRILVGDAGQRTQGFLRKLGLTRSYVMVNAILYSIRGQFDTEMRQFMDQPAVRNLAEPAAQCPSHANPRSRHRFRQCSPTCGGCVARLGRVEKPRARLLLETSDGTAGLQRHQRLEWPTGGYSSKGHTGRNRNRGYNAICGANVSTERP